MGKGQDGLNLVAGRYFAKLCILAQIICGLKGESNSLQLFEISAQIFLSDPAISKMFARFIILCKKVLGWITVLF